LARALTRYKNAFITAADLSEPMLQTAGLSDGNFGLVAADEEFLPFAANSFDLIASNLSLHSVNDLPGALAQIKRAFMRDGLSRAASLGGRTLYELRACLSEAEVAMTKGVSMRLSPQIDLEAATGLLRRADFALPVADREIFTFTYPDAFALMHDV